MARIRAVSDEKRREEDLDNVKRYCSILTPAAKGRNARVAEAVESQTWSVEI